MILESFDPIISLATASGKAAVALIRLSGDGVIDKLKIFLPENTDLPQPYKLKHSTIFHPKSKQILDDILFSIMKAPQSYTGEDMVEINCHGSDFVIQSILKSFHEHGVRQARKGEFTQRAYLNHKIDLTQARAIEQIVNSRTETQAKMAFSRYEGHLSDKLTGIKEEIIQLLAHIEAEIDYGEEDLPVLPKDTVKSTLQSFNDRFNDLLVLQKKSHFFQNGLRIAIIGPPNAGKSTLFNALLGMDRSMVSPIAGTTRDYLESQLIHRDVPITLIDTAGLGDYVDSLDEISQKRSLEILSHADIQLLIIDGSAIDSNGNGNISELLSIASTGDQKSKRHYALNKCDLLNQKQLEELNQAISRYTKAFNFISAMNSVGLGELLDDLLKIDSHIESHVTDDWILLSTEEEQLLQSSINAISNALKAMSENLSNEFIASDLHQVLNNIQNIVGETTSEDVLSALFSRFCVGK